MRHHSSQMLWTHEVQPSESTTNFKLLAFPLPFNSTCFSPQYQLIKKIVSEHELKKALRDNDASKSGLLSTTAN